jgi:hypothetical protein
MVYLRTAQGGWQVATVATASMRFTASAGEAERFGSSWGVIRTGETWRPFYLAAPAA